jgi:hypothetical protein
MSSAEMDLVTGLRSVSVWFMLGMSSLLIACEDQLPNQPATDASITPLDAVSDALSDGAAPPGDVDASLQSGDSAAVDAGYDDLREEGQEGRDAHEGAGDDASTTSAACATMLLGPAGGTLVHASGAGIILPTGALAAPTQLSLCDTGFPQMSAGTALSRTFEAGPDGQTFLKPVEVMVPFEPTHLVAGATLDTIQVRMAPRGASNFEALQSSVDLAAGIVHARTTHFTSFDAEQVVSPIFITTSPSLPDAHIQVAYVQQFTATGGKPPYTFSVPLGSALPPGLSLSSSGFLSGVPTVPNNYAFLVTVSDLANASVAMAVSLTVSPPNNPVPNLSQITPLSVAQGSGATVVTLTGTGFAPTIQVFWDSAAIPTTFVGATQAAASIPASYLLNAGTHQLSVSNPSPGGGTSGSVTFTITPAIVNPVPSIVSVAPSQLPLSLIDVQVAIKGTNFIADSSVVLGSQPIATSYVSSTSLLAAIPSAYLSNAGTFQIGVFNPPPGGGLSDTKVGLAVGARNPIPTLTTLDPPSAKAGSGPIALTLSGAGFVSGAQAFFGSTALMTTYVAEATTINTSVPAYLLADPGSVDVVLVNPAPGGGASAPLAFTIEGRVDGGVADSAGDASQESVCNVPCSAIPPSTAQCVNGGNACLVTLATGQGDLWCIVVDSANVYWAGYGAGTVMQISTAGGTAIPIATNQDYPVGIAVDSTHVYWTSRGLLSQIKAVRKAPIGGGPIVTLVNPPTEPSNIVVDSTSVYFTITSGGSVMKVPLDGVPDGGTPTVLASGKGPFGIALDSQRIYFTTTGDSTSNIGEVIMMGLDGSAQSAIASGQSDPWGVAVNADGVFWTANNLVMRGFFDGGAPTPLASAVGAAGIAVDTNNVYWVDNAGGAVTKVPVHGGSPTILAAGQTNPRCVAVDSTSVYWTNEGGTVMKLTPK